MIQIHFKGILLSLTVVLLITSRDSSSIAASSISDFRDKNLTSENLAHSRAEFLLLDMTYKKKEKLNPTSGSPSFSWTESELEFENQFQCNTNRLYMNFSDNPFSGRREVEELDGAEVPRKCIYYSMKYFAENITGATETLSPSFAKCPNSIGTPDHGQLAPCMTEEYVNGVYNSFVDVMDCFGISQKLVTPLIFSESGFHSNSFIPFQEIKNGAFSELVRNPSRKYSADGNVNLIGGRTGIGLLDQWSLSDIKSHIEAWRAKATMSPKKSCQRLRKIKGIFPRSDEIPVAGEMRCSLIDPSINPIRSLVYLGILFKSRFNQIDEVWKEMNLDDLFVKLAPDIIKSNGDMEYIKEHLFILSIRMGARKTVRLFKNWIMSRAQSIGKNPITKNDLLFHQNESMISQLSFQHYLLKNYSPWLKRYLNSFFTSNDILNKTLGEGVCTSGSYLSH